MRKIFLLSFLILPQLTLAQESTLNAEQSAGKKQFESYCSSCHGLSGIGDGPVSRALSKRPSNLRKIAKRRGGKFPVEELRKIIDGREGIAAHGSREMPVWGREFSDAIGGNSLGEELASGKIKVLIEYLKTIQE